MPPFSPERSRKILCWMILCLNNLGMIRIKMCIEIGIGGGKCVGNMQ